MRTRGFSFEWHEFELVEALDWSRSFHPGSVELCLNLSGEATLGDGRREITLVPRSLAFYHQGTPVLAATRRPGTPHRFITVEFDRSFLAGHLRSADGDLHPLVRAVVRGEAVASEVSGPEPLTASLAQLVESLRHPPVFTPARTVWFQCKALELATHVFFRPTEELFCTRQQRVARERVERVREILRQNLSEPPSLEELGRRVGCSPFYLSRLFSQETGLTIQRHLRQLRMERAAELLRTGQCNVTEAALEVGYSSLSHFSATFHETFGCCPGLYPLKTPTQQAAPEE
ncbi:MAG TPA: AraC family transcriptional regulator [Methylomirabilota bacterium]|nr:AraC family transcriptional regulator [Methylomirabilota bacterium]